MATPVGRRRLLFAGSDVAFATPWGRRSLDLSPNFVSVPYVTSYLLDDAARDPDRTCSPAQRTTTFYFGGALNRCQQNTCEGALRSNVMRAMAAQSPRANVVGVSIVRDRPVPTQLATYARAMLSSRYCLVPAGDTATSRRLFDAMAAGCEPVYLGKLDDGTGDSLAHVTAAHASNLPFLAVINWTQHVHFAGSLRCLAAGNLTAARQLGRELDGARSKTSDDAFESACRARLATYAAALSYFPSGHGDCAWWCYVHPDPWERKCAYATHACSSCAKCPSSAGGGVVSSLLRELYQRRAPKSTHLHGQTDVCAPQPPSFPPMLRTPPSSRPRHS